MKKILKRLALIISILLITACAKVEEPDDSVEGQDDVEEVIEETDSEEIPITFYRGAQFYDEEKPEMYRIYPEGDKLEIVWGRDSEEAWNPDRYELISFSESDSYIEITYLDEEEKEVTKKFKILSDSIVEDEDNNRYER